VDRAHRRGSVFVLVHGVAAMIDRDKLVVSMNHIAKIGIESS
jgi:hypothetical protein